MVEENLKTDLKQGGFQLMLNKKITEPWTSIGTILGQPVIDSYTFYLKKYKAKKGDIVAAEAKLPTGEGKVIDVIVWGRIMEIMSSNDFLPNEATKELTEENINIQDSGSLYSLYGDIFAVACFLITLLISILSCRKRFS